MTTDDFVLSREELLFGLPARRASTLLFAIESRTAQLVAKSEQATALYLTQAALETPEEAFLTAFAAGRDRTVQPVIQDIEHYAEHWASLVPDDAGVRAAIARMLGEKYTFTKRAVPQLRQALGLDMDAVLEAYEGLYNESLDAIYAPRITIGDRVQWVWAALADRLESLPPFWVAFALTLPVGPGLLALPIAVADVGALAGVVLLVVFGLLNMLTVAALAEAVARSGTTRFGLGYLGQLVSEYLGDAGSLFLSFMLLANNILALLVFYIGVASTLEGTTRLPSEVWLGVLFAVGLYFLSRKSLNSTVASALVVVTINLVLLIVIPLLALPQVEVPNLAYSNVPFVGGRPFDPGILRLIFGVMLTNFFSHMLVANYGQVVLRRDPSARSWIRGSIAAIGATTLISCLWVLLINGAIAPQTLANETRTVLAPLAERVGSSVYVLGSVFVVLSLGMATIHVSLGILFLIQERLPTLQAGVGNMLGDRGRFVISISPVIGVFLVAEWLAVTDSGSFAGLLGFLGVLTLPLLAGIFPILLLASSRRKGDFVPDIVYRIVGNPVVLAVAYVLFLASIFVHGLFIWETPAERVITLFVGLLVLGFTVVILRRGALNSRLVFELREDQSLNGENMFTITSNGRPLTADLCFCYDEVDEEVQGATGVIPAFDALHRVDVELPATVDRTMKIWAHRITPEGGSEALPAQVKLTLDDGNATQTIDLLGAGGQVTTDINGAPRRLTLTLAKPT